MNQRLIRLATADDLDILAELNREVQELHHNLHPHLFRPFDVVAVKDFITQRLIHPAVFTWLIFSEEGEPAGYLQAMLQERNESPFRHAMRFMEIDQMGVLPSFKGKGYGKALLQTAVDLAKEKEISICQLSVWTANSGAIAFYEKAGFVSMQPLFQRSV